MTERSFVLVYSLLSGAALIGMDQSPNTQLRQSADTIRNSQDALRRSASQELSKLAMKAAANNMYYEYPGGSGYVHDKWERMPVQFGRDYSDCP